MFAKSSLQVPLAFTLVTVSVSVAGMVSCASTPSTGGGGIVTVSPSTRVVSSPDDEAKATGADGSGASELSAKTKSEEKSDPADGPTSCPDEMVLVEGEYCTAKSNDAPVDEFGNTPGAGAADMKIVERECLKEWYAPQNKKRVCEEFETKGTCTGKMVKKRFCIDRYAWPNKKGHKPEVMNRYHQAQVKCAAVGKRMCTESEWTLSCEGPEMKPFPYGYVRDAKKCHGDEEWDGPNMTKVAQRDPAELRRLYKGKPSGQPECVSDFGVYDLPGNTDEVVASETFESGWRGKYESTNTGGPWYKGVRNQCRPKIYTHDEGFYHYYLSFRCCAEAGDGSGQIPATEPLTPHQKRKGWDMKRVEATAGISVKEMQALLEKKKTDPSCGCKTTKCRTFCGTLHGDDWSLPDSEKGSKK
jgi:sulfatase modifying factor 1